MIGMLKSLSSIGDYSYRFKKRDSAEFIAKTWRRMLSLSLAWSIIQITDDDVKQSENLKSEMPHCQLVDKALFNCKSYVQVIIIDLCHTSSAIVQLKLFGFLSADFLGDLRQFRWWVKKEDCVIFGLVWRTFWWLILAHRGQFNTWRNCKENLKLILTCDDWGFWSIPWKF